MHEDSNGRRSFMKLLLATPLALVNPLLAAPTALVKQPTDEEIARLAFEAFMNRGDASVFQQRGVNMGVPASDPFLRSVGLNPSLGIKHVAYRKAFPDLKVTILSSSQQGGVVTLRWRTDATHRAAIGNLNTTGKRVSVPGNTQVTFAAGKITKFVTTFDYQGLRSQLGAPRAG